MHSIHPLKINQSFIALSTATDPCRILLLQSISNARTASALRLLLWPRWLEDDQLCEQDKVTLCWRLFDLYIWSRAASERESQNSLACVCAVKVLHCPRQIPDCQPYTSCNVFLYECYLFTLNGE